MSPINPRTGLLSPATANGVSPAMRVAANCCCAPNCRGESFSHQASSCAPSHYRATFTRAPPLTPAFFSTEALQTRNSRFRPKTRRAPSTQYFSVRKRPLFTTFFSRLVLIQPISFLLYFRWPKGPAATLQPSKQTDLANQPSKSYCFSSTWCPYSAVTMASNPTAHAPARPNRRAAPFRPPCTWNP